MTLYVIAYPEGNDYLLLAAGTAVMGFNDRFEAEDFADKLDEPGEPEILEYDPDMGPVVVVVA